MATATMTSKGQVTIPAAIRAALGHDTGSRFKRMVFMLTQRKRLRGAISWQIHRLSCEILLPLRTVEPKLR